MSLVLFSLCFVLLAVFSSRVCGEQCVTALHEVGHPVVKIRPSTPVTREEASQMCESNERRKLLFVLDDLGDQERAFCGDSLVPVIDAPFGVSYETQQQLESLKTDEDVPLPYHVFGLFDIFHPYVEPSRIKAANLTSRRWHYVLPDHTFDCVLCQRGEIQLLLPDRASIQDAVISNYTSLSYYQTNVTSNYARNTADISEDEISAIRAALKELLTPSNEFPIDPVFHRSTLDNETLHLEFRVHARILKSVAASSERIVILNKYVVTVEDVSSCSQEETTDAYGVATLWPKTKAIVDIGDVPGAFQTQKNSSFGLIKSQRGCYFDDSSYRASWGEIAFWEPGFTPCTEDKAIVNEEVYKQFLGKEVFFRHIHQLHKYTAAPINTTTLKEVTVKVNRIVDLINAVKEYMIRELINITSSLLLDDGEDVCLVQDSRVYVLVSALEGTSPVVGLTLEYLDGTDNGNLNITLDRTQTSKPRPNQQFALSISDGLVATHKRMMMFVNWIYIPVTRGVITVASEVRTSQYIEVWVALVLPAYQKEGLFNYGSYSNYYVDIAFKPHSDFVLSAWSMTVMRCSAWNNDLGGWATSGCHTLKATRGNMTICRCSAKYFAINDGVATARYALNKVFDSNREADPFTDFFKDHTILTVATVIECLFSALGLCAIIFTAIFFKDWLENTGHKILLHMVFALTCNLFLGFTTSYVHLNTESVGCLALGVLRHYSFLAMFLWMLVLSSLQMKRLMTVAGAKAISHLILKVSIFAWGVPLVPIAFILAWNSRFYQTDRFDRGYCYPEGLVFQLTVQAPAGLVLLVNLGIFIAIVTHIFECRGEKKITRHSKNEKVEQLNKLKTSLFIFFLFGFTWVFHFLSELRIISSDFLFEYLFLMTATSHISILALFFIVLQESTREAWINFFNKLTRE